MLFRLRPEDFDPAQRPVPARRAPPPFVPIISDLSPEEWRVVHMMLSDHRRHGEPLARGAGPAADHARRLAAAGRGSK